MITIILVLMIIIMITNFVTQSLRDRIFYVIAS